jgi:hypothetical protein
MAHCKPSLLLNIAHSRKFSRFGTLGVGRQPSWNGGDAIVTKREEHLRYRGIGRVVRSLEMMKMLGLSVALLLFGSGIWANVSSGSLSQETGAWATHADR